MGDIASVPRGFASDEHGGRDGDDAPMPVVFDGAKVLAAAVQ